MNTVSTCCVTRVHARRSVRPHGDITVLITPVINVVGKQVGADAKFRHASELRFVGHLAMLQCMAVIGTRVLLQSSFNSINHQLRCFITVCMYV